MQPKCSATPIPTNLKAQGQDCKQYGAYIRLFAMPNVKQHSR